MSALVSVRQVRVVKRQGAVKQEQCAEVRALESPVSRWSENGQAEG